MAYIDVIGYEQAEGELKDIYDALIQKRGGLADVHMIQSLNPKSIVLHMDLYIGVMFGKSPLKRYQREMMAVVVSKANNCEYCQIHHAEALNNFWKNDEKVESFRKDYNSIQLEDIDKELNVLAHQMTVDPAWKGQKAQLDKLKSLGLDDRAVLDAHLVISYFNFVNRIVLGLGVALESHKGAGFIYD